MMLSVIRFLCIADAFPRPQAVTEVVPPTAKWKVAPREIISDISSDGKTIVRCSETGEIRLWTPTGGSQRKVGIHKDASAIEVSAKGSYIASWSESNKLRIWQAKVSQKLIAELIVFNGAFDFRAQ